VLILNICPLFFLMVARMLIDIVDIIGPGDIVLFNFELLCLPFVQ
jgi:hypothetical protein